MKWIDSIEEVLKDYGGSMHPEVIAEEIIRKGQQSRCASPPLSRVNPVLRNDAHRDKFMDLGNSKYMLLDTPIRSSALHPYAKHVPDIIEFPEDMSSSEKKLLEKELLKKDQLLDLIVRFCLPLVNEEVCFADILEKMGKVEFSNEEEERTQWVDAALLRRKVEELKQEIEKLRNEGNGPENQDLDAILRSLDEALKKTSEGKVEVSVLLLGELVISGPKPKVVIYYKNIQSEYAKDWKYVLAGVFVHEMFHAWNYFNAGGKRSVLEIDEPMVEFETLYFLKELGAFTSPEKVLRVSWKYECLVHDKQQSIGDVAVYGFGYYMFKNLRDDDPRKWIETYSEKSASIKCDDLRVKEAEDALIPIYPFRSESEADVLKLFKKIIFNKRVIPAGAEKFDATKTGSHVSLRDLVLACIETIGRKCFDAQELYAFAPIVKACMPHCSDLEEALKQQLDELVKDRILEDLAHDCYCVKLD